MRYYVVNVTIASSGTENRIINPYDNEETALRKFYEPLGSIGAGPKKICVLLLDEYFEVLEKKVWEHVEPDVITEDIIDTNPSNIDPNTGYPINNG